MKELRPTSADYTFGCFSQQKELVGLMTLDEPASFEAEFGIEISHIVAYPPGTGARCELIQCAVNESEALGYGGKVQLMPRSEGSHGFYRKAGFIPDTAGMWTLAPDSRENAGRWVKSDNRWRLNR